MHPLTYQVYKSIPLLEFEQFRHVEDRERLNEIRKLAREQVEDDSSDTSPQETYWGVGKTRMVQRPGEMWGHDEFDNGMWPRRTPRDFALEAGMTPLLDTVLTAEERVLARQVYDERPDGGLRTIGKRYGITHVAVLKRLKKIHKKLREALLLAYGPREEVDESEQG